MNQQLKQCVQLPITLGRDFRNNTESLPIASQCGSVRTLKRDHRLENLKSHFVVRRCGSKLLPKCSFERTNRWSKSSGEGGELARQSLTQQSLRLRKRKLVVHIDGRTPLAGTPPTWKDKSMNLGELGSKTCLSRCKFRFKRGYDFRNFRMSYRHEGSHA